MLVTEGPHATCKNALQALILWTATETKRVATVLEEAYVTLMTELANVSPDFTAQNASTRPLYAKSIFGTFLLSNK